MDGSSPDIKISGVCERDIDLLLTDEFASNPGFCGWFVKQIGLPKAREGKLSEVVRSATTSNGESDLVLTFITPLGTQLIVFIENKVGARFQPHQAERYRDRGESEQRIGRCSEYKTVLVAPQVYIGSDNSTHGFDSVVSYEAIREFFETQSQDSDRTQYKSYLITRAIEKSKHGYQMVEDKPVSQFWEDYWNLASETAPELQLNKPTPKPSGSSFICFNPADFPVNVSLIHKVAHGYVDLQFSNMGDHLAVINQIFKSRLRSEMEIVKAAKSAVIRIHVSKINMVDNLDINEGLIVDGIKNAQFLLDWFMGLDLTNEELNELSNETD